MEYEAGFFIIFLKYLLFEFNQFQNIEIFITKIDNLSNLIKSND